MRTLTKTETQEVAGGTFYLLSLLWKWKTALFSKYEPKKDDHKDYGHGKKW